MRSASLDHFGISAGKAVAVSSGVSIAAALPVGTLMGSALGPARGPLAVVVAVLVFYIVLSTPRRVLDGERVAQARESPILEASSAACLAVTGSRPRTLMLLKSRNPALASALRESGRRVLLGERVQRALDGSAKELASYSAGAALAALATFEPRAMDQGDEEVRGLESSSELMRETRVPALTTVCFFTPILLVLYAVLSHTYDPVSLGELAVFEFVVVDLAFYLSAADGGSG